MDCEVSMSVEADTFFAFNTLLSETRDLFIRQMDSSTVGLRGVLLRLNALMADFVPEVAQYFVGVRRKGDA